jgi:glycosyltransferase 2 family protein
MAYARLSKYLPLLGISIFLYLIYSVGISSIFSILLRLNAAYLFYALLVMALCFLIQNLRWKVLLSGQKIEMGFWHLMKLFMIGTFYGTVTPGKIGTFVRIKYVMQKTGKDTGECSVSMVLEKLLDFMVLSVLSIIGLLLLYSQISADLMSALLLSLVGFSVLLFLLLYEPTSRRIMRTLWRFAVPGSMKKGARKAFNSFFSSMISPRGLAVPVVLSFVSWLSLYFAAYLMAISLGISVPYHALIVVLPISTMIGMIPITVGGFGTREASWIFLFSIFGILSEEVIALSLLVALTSVIIPAAIGMALSLKRKKP